MRTAIQALSLLLFTLLFLFANYRLPDWLPADIYLRLDPLLGLSAILAGKEIVNRALWSLILIGATIVVGRFFCGYVCPLGAAIDFLDVLLFRKKARRELKADARLRPVKFALLIAFLSAALVGISLAYLLDPLALLTRLYTFVLYPLVITLLNLALDLVRPIFDVLGWVGLSHLNYTQPVYYVLHHRRDLRRHHRPESLRAAILVPVSLPAGSIVGFHFAPGTLQTACRP